MSKHELGQYFTKSRLLSDKVFQWIYHKNQRTLEPSFGCGHLLIPLLESNPNYPLDLYEIDTTLNPVVALNVNQNVNYGNFLEIPISQKYSTIIGNPPYIRTRHGNLYIDFIQKCLDLLDDNGEMIMIIPSNFFKITSSMHLIENLLQEGSFTHLYFPHTERLFEEASVDVVVFRYQKTIFTNRIEVNQELKYIHSQSGLITWSDNPHSQSILCKDLFHIYVGMVTGKDEVFRHPEGNLSLLTEENQRQQFICLDRFPCENPILNSHLLNHKSDLLNRKIRKFGEENWWEWGALRNRTHVLEHWGKPCIYVRCLTRRTSCFQGHVEWFGGSLICLIPKREIPLERICEYINSSEFRQNFIYSGRFKIGQRQLCNIQIPDTIIQ